MKRLTRRWFLKVLGALGLSSLLPGPSNAASPPLTRDTEALAEAIMPGAKDLGVDERAAALMLKRPETARIFFSGMRGLERYSRDRYGRPFHSLEEREREAVLRWMASLPRERIERLFFARYRRAVIAYYYTCPEVWKRLKYNGPPQPKGFMDYHLPPGGGSG